MPIISNIGRRSWKVRAALGLIYAVLVVGSISMIYPLLLMLAGSVKSDTDFLWTTPFPEFLVNDDVLWMKYVESKYALLTQAQAALDQPVVSWRTIRPPTPPPSPPSRDAQRETVK